MFSSPNKTKKKRLYLIDGYAMLYRAHFEMIRNPLINSKGMHTSALFGFINQIMKLINNEKPDLMIAAFDSPKKTFRHEKYPEYKATREKMPDEMIGQLPYLWKILQSMDIPTLEEPGFEADDIIGALTLKTQEFGQDEPIMIISSDKDFIQLQKFKNVKQWSPIQKKAVKADHARTYLFEHICRGDPGDGIPNILSKDDAFTDKSSRQSPLRQSVIEFYMENADIEGMNMPMEVFRNFQRNKTLIDLNEIPEHIYNSIISKFNEQKPAHRMKVLNYLINKRCKNLIEVVEEFYNG